MSGLKTATNFTYTENGALTHKTTESDLLDLFAMGAAYRTRSNEDVIVLFKNAFVENPTYALKCLFYLRDIRGGQGERRFFRVAMKWLAAYNTDAALRNLKHIPEFGRWDDLFVFLGTPIENEALNFIKHQLALDVQCKTPSLLAKWMPSENTSSAKTRQTASAVRKYLGMPSKEYRKVLSALRKRINVLERLMSEGRWDEIEFDKIPSKAGLKYKNAFARHDIERMKSEKAVQSYADFAKDETKTVNAKALYPYEVVDKGYKAARKRMDDTDRLMVNKYWDNLADYFAGKTFNGLAVVDTSASMTWSGGAAAPINVAISLGMYCAEKAKGPFAGHYVSFASRPQLIETVGVDFCDKVQRIVSTNLCDNTNLEATFDLLLNTAIQKRCKQEDLPESLIIISDMQIDEARGYGYYGRYNNDSASVESDVERYRRKWEAHGYKMPRVIYWNVNASKDTILDKGENVAYVSGCSPVLFEQIMKGKTQKDLMLDKLNSERYACIR
jgi:hypothetical protein